MGTNVLGIHFAQINRVRTARGKRTGHDQGRGIELQAVQQGNYRRLIDQRQEIVEAVGVLKGRAVVCN